jgi:hypothetical protein
MMKGFLTGAGMMSLGGGGILLATNYPIEAGLFLVGAAIFLGPAIWLKKR